MGRLWCRGETAMGYSFTAPQSSADTNSFAAPEDKIVELNFHDKFGLEVCQKCACDYVEIRDGRFDNSPLIGRWCSTDRPPIVRSRSPYLWLRFRSDGLAQRSGFRATYRYLPNHYVGSSIPKEGKYPFSVWV